MLRHFLVLALLCGPVLFAADEPFAAAAPAMPPNAVLKYWQAIILLPNDAGEKSALLFARPHDPATAMFVDSCRSSMALLREGAAIPRADWGLDEAAGPAMLMPHLARLRQLARVALISAQRDFADGKHAAALDTLFDTLALARHSAADSPLIGKLVEIAISNMTIDVLASHLPALAPELLEKLDAKMEKLPPSPSMAEILRAEQRMSAGWLRRNLTKGTGAERFRFLKEAGLIQGLGDAPLFAMLAGDEKKLTETLDEMDRFYVELDAILKQPPAQQVESLLKHETKWKQAGPLVSALIPAFSRSLQSVKSCELRLKMVSAAADVVRFGAAELAKHVDPRCAGAFIHAALAAKNEFSLSAQPVNAKEPLTLIFGQPQRPAEVAPQAVKPPAPPRENAGEF